MTNDERLTGFAFVFTEPLWKDAGSWKFCVAGANVIGALGSLEALSINQIVVEKIWVRRRVGM